MRFYSLFESIVNYVEEYNEFLTNLASGIFIRYSTESVLQHTHGKQLMCECLYLFGAMLLLLEHHIPGSIRERIVVAVLRHNGEATLDKFEDVSKLIRSTGVQHSADGKSCNRPKDYPEKYFSRFRIDKGLVKLIVQCLQSDDIYNGVHAFPSPEHRSTRLATQAGMLYVALYFVPELLCSDEGVMRGLVDKHFSETWIIAVYMGHIVDLSIEWKPYRAATKALANILTSENVGRAASQNLQWYREAKAELSEFLTEGVLSEQYLLVHMESLLQCMRKSNVALRWQLMHRRCWQPKFAEIIRGQISDNEVMDLLLQCAQLEYQVREMFTALLGAKMEKWVESRTTCVGRLNELSEYFSGEMALTRVRRDDRMVQWFAGLANEVGSMFNGDEETGEHGNGTQHSTVLGRKIEKTIQALEDVEQFEQVDTDVQIKQFLADTREQLRQMIRVVNIKRQDLTKMEVITDLSYGFEVLKNYTRTIHERVRTEPSYSVLLRAGFVKLSSILDVPLTRINEIGSPDLVSVSQFYSGELVDFMRRVLDVIPRSVFEILQKIIEVQTLRLKPLPVKFESQRLTEFSQLDERYRLARMTNKASTFTEGILAMESTGDGRGFYIGVNRVDARSILHDGLRKELVRQVCEAMHATLVFKSTTGAPLNVGSNVKELAAVRESFDRCMRALANRMDGFRRSIEYVQDYVDMAGLKMWQEELARIVNYNIEQECNRYIKKKVLDYNSKYQSKIIPIPRFAVPGAKDHGSLNSDAINFMGRAMNCLLAMTDPSTTIFAPEAIGWFTADGEEICGIKTFATLQRGINVTGLSGLDRLLAFRVVHELGFFLGFYKTTAKDYLPRIEQIRDALHPTCRSPSEAAKLYAGSLKKLEKLMSPTLRVILRIGQAQLIRRQLSHVLHFSCRLDANILFQVMPLLLKRYAQPQSFMYVHQFTLHKILRATLELKHIECRGARRRTRALPLPHRQPLPKHRKQSIARSTK